MINIYYTLLCFVYIYSVEIILRAEAVECAQAGDKSDFTGTLIVVPDVATMSLPGIVSFVKNQG